ncbi:MAG: hypothetical protein ACXWCZ_09475 [Flavisolibacter sp.]
MKICLLASIFILIGFSFLYEPLSMSMVRYVAVMFTVSFLFLPAVILFNALLNGVRALKLHPVSGWGLFLISIILGSHLFISVLMILLHIHPGSAEIVWLIMNSSLSLAFLLRIRTIHHLFKSFYHEHDASYSIG